MKAVDAIVMARIGLSVHDLPDINYADMYDDGMTPRGAANRAIKNAKSEVE